MDLSLGYTPTGIGLEFCGCNEDVANCELIHIVLQRTEDNNTQLIECPDIILTERWWREEKDLVDIFYAETCEELNESITHSDRYEINTAHLEAGDTISILVCKTNPFDDNIIELSASSGPECSNLTCAPKITCPIEFKLRLNLECQYVLPDFRLGVTLEDTCSLPPSNVTTDFTLMQTPLPGSVVTEDLFTEVKVSNAEGEIVATCDISVILATNTPPIIDEPDNVLDIRVGDPLPPFEELAAVDTIAGDILYPFETERIVDPYLENVCSGYSITYRWRASDSCNLTSEITRSFNVLPNVDGPAFASLPADIDTVHVGESLPILVDLVAINPDGTTEGIIMESMVDPYEEDDCFGYSVTYRWTATDSCGYSSELEKTFYVEPDGAPPIFTTLPDEISNIRPIDTFPVPQTLTATSVDGDPTGIEIIHSIDPFVSDPCSIHSVTYRWTAIDSCGLTTSITRIFEVVPDTLTAFILEGMGDMMIEVSIDCNEIAEIELPIDVIDHPDKTVRVIVTDEEWNILTEYDYTGPSDFEFGSGNSHIIYSISDQCGNEIRDTINIFANDISAPIFICPSQQQIFISDFFSCSTEATWIPPQAFDNCDELQIIQTAGPDFGAQLSVGVYQIVYKAEDGSNNASSCSFELVISPMSLTAVSCLPISVELDSMCDAQITKQAIIGSELLICAPDYTVEVIAGIDTLRGDTFNIGPYIGQTIKYVLCDPILDICCENELNLVDSIAPVILCQDSLTFSCLYDLDAYVPAIAAECGPVAWQIRDLDYTPVCNDPSIQAQLIREFIAIDQSGNTSIPCIQTIDILYANIDLLLDEGRLTFPNDTSVSCEVHNIASISDSLFGFPMLDTVILTLESNNCGITAEYRDEPYVDIGCTKIIKRHWTIIEELCGYGHREVTGTQLIKIIDTVGPVLTPLIGIIHQPTSLHDCYGYFVMPDLEITDNCQDSVDITTVFLYEGVIYSPEDTIRLPLGYNEIIIISEDGCNNKGRDTIAVQVVDQVRPVAACLEQSVIAVTGEISKYPLSALDIGSYDNCEIASIQISKSRVSCTERDTSFGEYVMFCCEDIGTSVEVLLKVIDHDGNENICWGIVQVQEKLAPQIFCPPSLVLDCSIELSRSDDENDPYKHLFGSLVQEKDIRKLPIDSSLIIDQSGELIDGQISDICNDHVEVIVETAEEINQCGIGFIYRTFTGVDASGNRSRTCTQTIEIRRSQQQDSIAIVWPEQEIFIQSCNETFAISPDSIGRPLITEQPCALFGISYADTYVNFDDPNNGTCSKIIRTWTIINWCAENPLEQTYVQNQIIKIADVVAPLFEECDNRESSFSSDSNDCDVVLIMLTKQAFDDCTNRRSLEWSVYIDYNVDGNRDFETSLQPDSIEVSLNKEVPIGRHKVVWTVVDKCGNKNSCEEIINVENSKKPTPLAHGISTSLSNQGDVVVWADDLILKIENECLSGGRGSISRFNEGFDDSFDQITFTCDDVGVNVVKVYAYRTLLDGTVVYDYVTVVVDVEDNSNLCNEEPEEVITDGLVSGLVYTTDGRLVPGVNIEMNKAFPEEYMTENTTDNYGFFDLGKITDDDTYYIEPSLDGNTLDGVNTLDIVLIQRHIIGIDVFDSPFKIIASDANRDEKVSVADLLEIRKAILHIPSKFGDYNPWRFINANFPFYDDRYPLHDEPEERSYVRRTSSKVDIVAMKVGDLNGSVKISKTEEADSRSTEQISIIDRAFNKGETFDVYVLSTDQHSMFGIQINLAIDHSNLEIIDVESTIPEFDFSYNAFEDNLYVSSSSGKVTTIEEGRSLFRISFVAKSTGTLRESVSLSNENVASEFYSEDLIPIGLQLSYASLADCFKVYQNVPNPFTHSTQIRIELPEEEHVSLEVYSATGRKLITRYFDLKAGKNDVLLTKADIGGSGLYYYKVRYKNEVITTRMVLLE